MSGTGRHRAQGVTQDDTGHSERHRKAQDTGSGTGRHRAQEWHRTAQGIVSGTGRHRAQAVAQDGTRHREWHRTAQDTVSGVTSPTRVNGGVIIWYCLVGKRKQL